VAITDYGSYLAGLLPPYTAWKTTGTGEASGEYFSPFYVAGNPGAATAPSPGLAGAALTSYSGQLPFPSNVSGDNTYLADLTVTQGGNVGAILLCDRLWHNSGFTMTTTTAETINSVAWPARDYSSSTSGVDVMVGLEVSTATTNGSAITNTTCSYTDSDGNAGNTGTITSFPATAVAGTFVPFSLAAGDKGVRSVQTLTKGTSYGGGAMHLVAYRVIAVIGTPTASTAFTLTPGTPRKMSDGTSAAVPFLLYALTGTAIGAVTASIVYCQQ
jgi:hypothetical protein